MEFRWWLVQSDDPSDEILEDPDTYYRKARTAARQLAQKQLEDEARTAEKAVRSTETHLASA